MITHSNFLKIKKTLAKDKLLLALAIAIILIFVYGLQRKMIGCYRAFGECYEPHADDLILLNLLGLFIFIVSFLALIIREFISLTKKIAKRMFKK